MGRTARRGRNTEPAQRLAAPGLSFNAVAHGGERAGLKSYLRNREWRTHAWVCAALAAVGAAVFMSVLGTSVTAARRRNAPVFVALPAGAEYASPNALHRHAVRLRDVLFPPAAAGDARAMDHMYCASAIGSPAVRPPRPPAQTIGGGRRGAGGAPPVLGFGCCAKAG